MPARFAVRIWLAPASSTAEEALTPPQGEPQNSRLIEESAGLLRSGAILAIKGLGGFHLACDATNPQAVMKLRERKRRFEKPLAVMMATLDEITRHCLVTPGKGSAPFSFLSHRASAVRPESTVTREVAPGNRYLGVISVYAPSSSSAS
jgi:hydrogenase maturation protein HypF